MAIRKSVLLVAWLYAAACLAMIALVAGKARAQDVPPPPPPTDPNAAAVADPAADPNVEVLTRGPVHEAYAAPVTGGQAEAGVVVPKQPPAPIEEMPPDMKPDAENAVWIPGYWGWDDERNDFLWVSGVWRVPPPGFRWMPGYWQNNQGQYQWISGYWMPAHLEETTFMPQPPPSIDNGPTSPQPDENHFWVAGHQQWYDGRYVWQPGYWAVSQPDWIWVPASYYWCPSGWVYVPGYWDYPLARRGIVFSPVYFARPVAYYRPAICIDVGVLSFSLFSRPAYCHYYFGDYYDDRYLAFGIRPWYYNGPHYGHDPLYGYYRWYHEDHLGEREWGRHLAGWHEYYRVHPDMRPPHTLAAERALVASGAMRTRPDAHQLYMAQDVHHLDSRAAGAMRVQPVSAAQHAQLTQAARETVHFQQERQQFERTAAAGAHGPSQPTRMNLTSMPSYKSNSLPGASAANIKTAVSRPNISGAASAAVGRNQINNTGRNDRRDTGGRAEAGAAAGGATAAPAGRSGIASAGGAAAAGRGAAGGASTAGAATTGRAGGGTPATGGASTYRPGGGTGPASGGYSPPPGRGAGPSGGPPPGRGGNPPSGGGSSGRGSSSSGRGDDRSRDKDKGKN